MHELDDLLLELSDDQEVEAALNRGRIYLSVRNPFGEEHADHAHVSLSMDEACKLRDWLSAALDQSAS